MKSYDNPLSHEHQEGGGSLSSLGDLVIEPIKIERELFPHGDPEYLKNPYLTSTMNKLSGQSKYDMGLIKFLDAKSFENVHQ